MKTVIMRQLARSRWRLETITGIVIQDDIPIYSVQHAEDWVRTYISSFPCWRYEIKPKET